MPEQKPESQPQAPERFPVWESVAIILAIASLWPAFILQVDDPTWKVVWDVVAYAMLSVMAFIAIRRTYIMHRLAREAREARQRRAEQGADGPARLPWEQRPPE